MNAEGSDPARRAVLGALALLGGCAVARIAPDAARLRGIRTVGVPTPAMAQEAMAPLWNTTGLLSLSPWSVKRTIFVGDGFTVENAFRRSDRDRRLQAALAAQGFDGPAHMTAALVLAGRAAGYEVTPFPLARPRLALLDSPPTGPFDAFLDVAVETFGFGAPTPNSSFLPMAVAVVRASAGDGTRLLQDTLHLGAPNPNPEFVRTVAPPAGVAINDHGRFDTAPERLAGSIDAGLQALAKTIFALLRGAGTA